MGKIFEILKLAYSWLKSKSAKFVWLFLLLVALLAGLVLTMSCSRSTLRFKGTGDIEYFYKGQNGPTMYDSKQD